MPAKPKILIVDDDTDRHLLLNSILNTRFQVSICDQSSQAMDKILATSPDLILSDLQMPNIDGYELCQQIKSNPKTAQIPVIIISSLFETPNKVKAFEVGASDYITYPFDPTEVLARVSVHIKINQQQDELKKQNNELEFSKRKSELLQESFFHSMFKFFQA